MGRAGVVRGWRGLGVNSFDLVGWSGATLLGEVGHRDHQNPKGEQYSESEWCSDQQACIHFVPSHCYLSALAAVVVGVPTLRLRGHYFAIATLLIGSSVQIVFQRWDWVGAASGLYVPIERASPWFYLQFHTSKVPYYYLALGAAAGGYLAVWKLRRSRLGFRLQALRDEPDAAASLGIAIARHKVLAFMISGAMMSVAGTFYAQYVLVLDPERLFSAEISIIVLLMTVLGGSGTLWGPALGAAILVPLSEYSRIWFGGTGRTIDLILYGILILLVCMWRPSGILSLLEERIRRRAEIP